MNVQAQVDKLISWYEKNKPDAGKQIQCDCGEDALALFATYGTDGHWWYRGRILEAVGRSTAKKSKDTKERKKKQAVIVDAFFKGVRQ